MVIEHLLEEFPPVNTVDWEAAIARDLKGADYQKRLIWRAEEGITVKPYYRADDLKTPAAMDPAPGQFPFRRGVRAAGGWILREEIDATSPEEANRAARAAIAAGAEGIVFTSLSIRGRAELDAALTHLDRVPVHFALADEPLIRFLIERLRPQPQAAVLSTNSNPLSSTDFAAEIVQSAPEGFVPFTIDAAAYEETGATTVEELGFALAAGIDFLSAVAARGADVNRAAAAVEFHFAIGGNYFFQIAKLRAFRMLWAQAAGCFGVPPENSGALVTARTSRWDKTVYDPQSNVLRATIEAMAAIVGGADAVSIAPYDECFRQAGEPSQRLARNTQLLLKHEAWLGRAVDPGGGSYYLEALTDDLAREGWKKTQEIEAAGGYRRANAEGLIAQALERSRTNRVAAVDRRHRVFIGTNQFANPAEQALDRVDESRMNGIDRGPRAYEDLRLRTEWHAAESSKIPRILLAEIGDAKMRVLRSNFAMNFFACAGFAITVKRFKGAAELSKAEADLIVLCSSDTDYYRIATRLTPRLKMLGRSTPVIVAGYPEDAEELRAAGVADFVHLRSNPIDLLKKWQERLGVGS